MNGLKTQKRRDKLKAILKNSEFFNQIFEGHSDGYCALDIAGTYVQVNKACETLTGYKKSELYNLTYKDLLTREYAETVNACYEKALNGEVQHYQCTIKTKNNERLNLDVTNIPIIVDHEIIGIYGVIKDRTKYHDNLEESKLLNRDLVEHYPDGVVIIQNERFVFANKEATILLGVEGKENVIGENIRTFFSSTYNQSILECLKLAENGSPTAFIEEKIVQSTGKEVNVEVKAIPTVFAGIQAVFFIIRDITDRKLAHELMINSEKLSVAGQLAAGIAHEIRNPITAIKGFLQLMEGEGQFKQEFFSVISTEINRIELILSELLSLAKPQLDQFCQKNIRSIIQHVVALTRSQAILHNIHITTNIKNKQLFVLCDENKLKQVFINFIKNAIEAMPDGGKITVCAESDGNGAVVIKIIDEGPGIPKEILNQIGNPFFTTKENGTGLGIMVSTEIIKHHNGEVKIHSNSNGTVISVILPISKQ